MSAQGKTRAEIDQMTLLDLVDLNHYWKNYPPVGEVVAAALGVKPQQSAPKAPAMSELEAIAGAVNQGGVRG